MITTNIPVNVIHYVHYLWIWNHEKQRHLDLFPWKCELVIYNSPSWVMPELTADLGWLGGLGLLLTGDREPGFCWREQQVADLTVYIGRGTVLYRSMIWCEQPHLVVTAAVRQRTWLRPTTGQVDGKVKVKPTSTVIPPC